MSWEFVVCDKNGVAQGEVKDAVQRQAVGTLNNLMAGNLTVRNDNDQINNLRQLDQGLIKAYRNGVLKGVGPIAPNYHKDTGGSAGAQGGGTTQFYWASAGWFIGMRLLEASKSNTGVSYGNPPGVSTGPMDRADIAAAILDDLNNAIVPKVPDAQGNLVPVWPQSCMDIGIRVDPAIRSHAIRTTSTYVGPWYYKNALQALLELSGTLDGFDWAINPVEPVWDGLPGLKLGVFTCATNLGQTKKNVVFEYGDGRRNVASFTEDGDASFLQNRNYWLPNGFPDSASTQQVLSQYDAAAISARGRVYEDTVQCDSTSTDLVTNLLQQNIEIRKVPRTLISFVPTIDPETGVMPQYGTDWSEGDVVQFRAVEFGEETVNGFFRIFQATFDIDQQGNEQVTPVLFSQDVNTGIGSSQGA